MKDPKPPRIKKYYQTLVFECYKCGEVVVPSLCITSPKAITLQFVCECEYYTLEASGTIQTFFSKKILEDIKRMNIKGS